MTVGLKSLDPALWIEDAPDHDEQLRERHRLLDERDDVLASLPRSENAAAELLAMLAAHLPRHLSHHYVEEGAALTLRRLGTTVCTDPRLAGPLARAARLVPEDLCLMRADSTGRYRLVAAALCFPTRWRLHEKLGEPMDVIHAPVPGYAEGLATATDRVMAALTPARPLWRENWSLLDSPALYQPERVPLARPIREAEVGERVWLRSERQTLTRLPESGDVLFTIRIRQCTLDALCRIPGAAARLREQVATMAPALKAYKAITALEPMLLRYLDRGAGETESSRGG